MLQSEILFIFALISPTLTGENYRVISFNEKPTSGGGTALAAKGQKAAQTVPYLFKKLK